MKAWEARVEPRDVTGWRPTGDAEMSRLMAALEPIEPDLMGALAAGDHDSALKIARKALEIAGETLRAPDLIPDNMAWVQAFVLDFKPQPLIALADATLMFHEGFGLEVAHWSGAVDAELAWDYAKSLDSGHVHLYLLGDGRKSPSYSDSRQSSE